MIDPNGNKFLIVIAGPTAIGKTSTSLRLAETLNAEIISADSRQIYRELNIGVAKPTQTELRQTNHHFINHVSIAEMYSTGQYEREAITFLDQYFVKRDIIICCGGNGLYINALRYGLDKFPPVSNSYRIKYEQIYQEQGIIALQVLLKKWDPIYFAKMDNNNPVRLIRALSVCDSSQKSYSSFLNKSQVSRRFIVIPIVLTTDRSSLYNRINSRIDDMMDQGLEKEVQELLPYRHLSPLKTVGYQEFFPYFDQEISLDQAIKKVKQKSRNYAKRQITWFQKHGPWEYIDAHNYELIEQTILERIK